MDATRTRREKDPARRAWYACFRQRRWARHLGFLAAFPAEDAALAVGRKIGLTNPRTR